MSILTAVRSGDVGVVQALLINQPGLANYHNPQFDKIREDVKPKSIYCAECYQKIKLRPVLSTSVRGYVCDWPKHRRSVHKTDSSGNIGCCDTPSGEQCNWMTCPDCFLLGTYDLQATHQYMSRMVGYSPLIVACNIGNCAVVRLLLNHGAELEDADPNGVTPLMAAASAGHCEAIRELVSANAMLNTRDKEGRTALFLAAEIGDLDCVQVLIDGGADINIPDRTGATLLHAAASVGSTALLKLFLEKGLDPNAADQDGSIPMHWLNSEARPSAVQALIDGGSDIDSVDKDGMTPIAYATMRNGMGVVKLLLRAGANMEIDRPYWYNCLYTSCLFPAPRLTEMILEAGCTMKPEQRSPLETCASRSLVETADICLRYGVKGLGRAMQLAAYLGKVSVLKVFLLHYSDDEDASKDDLNMSLFHAVRYEQVGVVKLLLEYGADPTYRLTASGRAVVDYARSKKIRNLLNAQISGNELPVEAEDEALVMNNKDYLRHALFEGTKPWGRSKLMIVGDGRAGKTALANSIMGEEFRHTESTIGISQMTCDVKHAEVGAGAWEEYVKPSNELEAALAKIVAARAHLTGEENTDMNSNRSEENDLQGAEESDSGMNTGGYASSEVEPESDSLDRKKSFPHAMNESSLTASKESHIEDDEAEGGVGTGLAIDDALVMKYLANLNDSTKFVISLFDYGGQTVFNVIHHLFLTRYGVYALVFNMEQLVSEDAAVQEKCLATLSFWLNSIVMHTLNEETGLTAPIFLIGTHKDIVTNHADHAIISRILQNKFGQSIAWDSVQQNSQEIVFPKQQRLHPEHPLLAPDAQPVPTADTDVDLAPPAAPLCFFPVDNRRGRRDTTISNLMHCVEVAIDASHYVHAERPLTWLKTMDRLTASGKTYLSLAQATQIARECGVPEDVVPNLLSFLNEMGVLMWHDDVALRDVVILDAVTYFVAPATTIICKHLATASDSTRHVVEAHKACNKEFYDEWMIMVHRGIASERLLLSLLRGCGDQASVVLGLMSKFGLLVELDSSIFVPTSSIAFDCSAESYASIDVGDEADEDGTKSSKGMLITESIDDEGDNIVDHDSVHPIPELVRERGFLIPALLPPSPEEVKAKLDIVPFTFMFVFTCSSALFKRHRGAYVELAECSMLGFMPRGLYERFLCKIIAWRNESDNIKFCRSPAPSADLIYQDHAHLELGDIRFRLDCRPNLNALQVRVFTGDANLLRGQLESMVDQILHECMKALRFICISHTADDNCGKLVVN